MPLFFIISIKQFQSFFILLIFISNVMLEHGWKGNLQDTGDKNQNN